MRDMKDSGVEWIGQIPIHWSITRNKNLIYEINERCDADTQLPLLSVSEYYGVAPKAEKIEDGKVLIRAESLEGYKICRPNDVAMNIMLAWKRAQAVSKHHGIISPAYCVYRKKNNAALDMNFFHYLIRSDLYANVFKRYSTGIIESRLRLYPDKFLALYSHVPPLEEQRQIAGFLDEKLAQVDTLIANVQAQIEKLKAYKQSMITEVVTKGLDPSVPMKDSGIYNIGEIPECWKVRRLKTLATICNGKEVPSQDGNIPVYGSGGVFKYTDTVLHSGISMLYGRKGTIDRPLLVDGDFWTVDTMFYTSEIHDIEPKYLYYCSVSLIDFPYYKTGSVLPSMTQTELGRVWVTHPPINEQLHIIDYLDEKTSQIDRLIAIKQAKIEKLEQYKRSLIYEYVTGKKEVS